MRSISRRRFTIASALSSVAIAVPQQSTSGRTTAKSHPKIRVGQIGTKHAHAVGKLQAALKLSDHFEVVGVVEPDPEQRQKLQQTEPFRGLSWMSVDQLLAQPELQMVLVETEIDALLPTAARCLTAGKHIHLDKPAGASLKEFQHVIEIARNNKRLIQMGYMFRGNPAFRFLFDAVKRGWLGEIFEIHGVMSKKVGNADRAELARYQGGAMFELGCHLIDAVIQILGKPEKVVASNRKTHPELDQLNDNCLAIFHYPKATATVRSSVVEVDGNRRRQFTVCGTLGTIKIEPLEPPHLTLTLDRPQGNYRKGTQVVELDKMDGRYDADLINFAAAIRGEREFEYSLEHDLDVQACVLKASEMD